LPFVLSQRSVVAADIDDLILGRDNIFGEPFGLLKTVVALLVDAHPPDCVLEAVHIAVVGRVLLLTERSRREIACALGPERIDEAISHQLVIVRPLLN